MGDAWIARSMFRLSGLPKSTLDILQEVLVDFVTSTYGGSMASSPARPAAPIKVSTTTPSVLLADVISYGYALVVVIATLQMDLAFEIWQGVAIMVLFVVLRGIAHELRKDARRTIMREARRTAALRAQSPALWSTEQRDGLGRRVDIGV